MDNTFGWRGKGSFGCLLIHSASTKCLQLETGNPSGHADPIPRTEAKRPKPRDTFEMCGTQYRS